MPARTPRPTLKPSLRRVAFQGWEGVFEELKEFSGDQSILVTKGVTPPEPVPQLQPQPAAGGAGARSGNNRSRSFRELIQDATANPSKWKVVRIETLPSTNMRNPGGTSIQEVLRNEDTGEEIVRHTLLKADGSIFEASHFRPFWK